MSLPVDISPVARPSKTSLPTFASLERIPVLEEGDYYPCTDCHDGEEEPVPIIRELEDEHENITLNHGQGRFWCLTCHHIDDRDWLVDQAKIKISFDDSSRLCGMCHFQKEMDYTFGAHGKRIGDWNAERVLMPCTACHDPHDPAIKPRKPWQPPQARKGLQAGSDSHPSAKHE